MTSEHDRIYAETFSLRNGAVALIAETDLASPLREQALNIARRTSALVRQYAQDRGRPPHHRDSMIMMASDIDAKLAMYELLNSQGEPR